MREREIERKRERERASKRKRVSERDEERKRDEEKTAFYLLCWQRTETQTHAHIMKTHKDPEHLH